jgi:uncharacterized protein (TIGR00369 family)
MPDTSEPAAATDFEPADRSQALRQSGSGYWLCRGCWAVDACRLGIRTETLVADGAAEFEITCPSESQGAPGVAHGGWTAAIMDEALGHAPLLAGSFCVTKKMTIEYLRPVPVGVPLILRAHVVAKEQRRWTIEASLLIVSNGAELAKAEGVWVEPKDGHYARFDTWMKEA